MIEIYFVRSVIEDDLRHVAREDIPRILKKIRLLDTDAHAGLPLGGELNGFRKLVVGRNTYRVVYRVEGSFVEICQIWAVGHRRNAEVYLAATRRVREAATVRPELASLAELMATVAEFDGLGDRTPEPAPDPVPDWLYKQLVHTAGRPPHEVAPMTGEEAFAAWNDWMSRQR